MKKKLTMTENPLFHQRKITEVMKGFLPGEEILFSYNLPKPIILCLISRYHRSQLSCCLPGQGIADRSPRIFALRYSLLSKLSEKILVLFSQLITGIIFLSLSTTKTPIYLRILILC